VPADPPGIRSATTAAAPRRIASAMNWWPSTRIPVIATKRLPGVTARESDSIDPTPTPAADTGSALSIPASRRRAASGRAARVGCTVAVYGRVAPIMAGKKQKRAGGAPVSLADALTATRAARRRVLALAERLEETERTILAAMAPAPAAVATTTPAKRPVGRPPKAAAGTAAAKRPVGRPRTRTATGATPATRSTTGRRPVGRPPKG